MARVAALYPEPRLAVEERRELRFVSIGYPRGGCVSYPALGFYAISLRLRGTAYLREESWPRGLVRSPDGTVFVQALHRAVEYAWRRQHVAWALCVDASEVEQAAQETGLVNPQRIEILSRTGHDATAGHMVRALGAQALLGAHPGQALACAQLRKAMALHLLGTYGAFAPKRRDTRARPLSRAALQRGIAYLEDNLARDCTLDQLASEMRVSSFTLSAQFRRATGETPAAYVDRVRVERAQSRLRGGRIDGSALALELGFGDAPSFRRVFKRISGESPEDFARRHGTSLDWSRHASETPW